MSELQVASDSEVSALLQSTSARWAAQPSFEFRQSTAAVQRHRRRTEMAAGASKCARTASHSIAHESKIDAAAAVPVALPAGAMAAIVLHALEEAEEAAEEEEPVDAPGQRDAGVSRHSDRL